MCFFSSETNRKTGIEIADLKVTPRQCISSTLEDLLTSDQSGFGHNMDHPSPSASPSSTKKFVRIHPTQWCQLDYQILYTSFSNKIWFIGFAFYEISMELELQVLRRSSKTLSTDTIGSENFESGIVYYSIHLLILSSSNYSFSCILYV